MIALWGPLGFMAASLMLGVPTGLRARPLAGQLPFSIQTPKQEQLSLAGNRQFYFRQIGYIVLLKRRESRRYPTRRLDDGWLHSIVEEKKRQTPSHQETRRSLSTVHCRRFLTFLLSDCSGEPPLQNAHRFQTGGTQ